VAATCALLLGGFSQAPSRIHWTQFGWMGIDARSFNGKTRQRLGPMRRSHPPPCPRQNDRRRVRALEHEAHPGDRLPAPRGRTIDHTSPRSPAGAVDAHASTPATSDRRRRWCDSHRTGRCQVLTREQFQFGSEPNRATARTLLVWENSVSSWSPTTCLNASRHRRATPRR
jgi:hypothetical protein